MIPSDLIDIIDGRIVVDDDKIDIFDYPVETIPEYTNNKSIKPYNELNIVYLDIETYSSYWQQLDYFTDSIVAGFMRYGDDKVIEKITNQLNDAGVLVKEHIQFLYMLYKDKRFDPLEPQIDSVIGYLYKNREYLTDIYDKPALSPDLGQVALIGIMNESGKSIIINCLDDEVQGLKKFIKILEKKKPDILAHFNGFWFDLPFIIKRCEILGIRHPFWVNKERLTCFNTAMRFAKPTTYNAIYLRYGDRKCAIIDLYHQALAWDFVNHKLTKYTLKQVVLQLGIRKESRLELTPAEMFSYIRDGNLEPLEEYLTYDLEDTKLLGDYLIPPIYYQSEFLNWNLQSISTGGMGSKWDSMLQDAYKANGITLPETDDKLLFDGALVGSIAGLYSHVSKVDVTSMYPHIMLIYQVHSYKDTKMLQLGILAYCLQQRMVLKKLAKTSEVESERQAANHRQNSAKILINSGYGMLATRGKIFNDYIAAANVTAYGRAILKYALTLVREAGGIPVSWDTDGIYYTTGSFDGNRALFESINEKLPNNGKYKIGLEYELECKAFYTPPLKKGNHYVLSDDQQTAVTVEDHDEDDLTYYYKGLRKSYIIVKQDGSYKAKGKFVKRNATGLEKEFMPMLCGHYMDGTHNEYVKGIISALKSHTYPVDKLSVTRKISANEKRLVELGIGRVGDEVTIWKGTDIVKYGKRGTPLKSKIAMWVNTPVDIDWQFYIDEVKKWVSEFNDML